MECERIPPAKKTELSVILIAQKVYVFAVTEANLTNENLGYYSSQIHNISISEIQKYR